MSALACVAGSCFDTASPKSGNHEESGIGFPAEGLTFAARSVQKRNISGQKAHKLEPSGGQKP